MHYFGEKENLIAKKHFIPVHLKVQWGVARRVSLLAGSEQSESLRVVRVPSCAHS